MGKVGSVTKFGGDSHLAAANTTQHIFGSNNKIQETTPDSSLKAAKEGLFSPKSGPFGTGEKSFTPPESA